jgi:hypothetical protein
MPTVLQNGPETGPDQRRCRDNRRLPREYPTAMSHQPSTAGYGWTGTGARFRWLGLWVRLEREVERLRGPWGLHALH